MTRFLSHVSAVKGKMRNYNPLLMAGISMLMIGGLFAGFGASLSAVYAESGNGAVESQDQHHDNKMGMMMDMDMHSMNMSSSSNNNNNTMLPMSKEQGASNATVISSPAVYNITNRSIQVKVSWTPETIVADVPTKFTFEFLNSTTGDHLRNVTYAVHEMLNGNSVGHRHDANAADGIGMMENKFDSQGSLLLIVELAKIGDRAIGEFASFSLHVAS